MPQPHAGASSRLGIVAPPAAGLVLAIWCASGAPAFAQPQSSVAIVAAGARPGGGRLLTVTETRTGGPRDSLTLDRPIADPTTTDPPNRFFLDSFASVQPGALGPSLTVNGVGRLKSTDSEGTWRTTAFIEATAIDDLTLTSTDPNAGLLRLRKTLKLTTVADFLRGGSSGDDFTVDTEFSLEINGTGIGDGPRGGNVFSAFHLHDANDEPDVRFHLTAPDTIDFDFDFRPGVTQLLSLQMLARSAQTFEDRDGSLEADHHFGFEYDLDWLSGGSLIDVATGRAACGVTATSASGARYLSGITIEPCLGTGGGQGSGSVPEPSSWALLISGFGLSGWALRRRARPGEARPVAYPASARPGDLMPK